MLTVGDQKVWPREYQFVRGVTDQRVPMPRDFNRGSGLSIQEEGGKFLVVLSKAPAQRR